MGGAETPPDTIDGQSLLPLLKKPDTVDSWRDRFIIEYHGETNNTNQTAYPYSCFINLDFIHDCWNNTYNTLRIKNSTVDIMFANFSLTPFREFYDLYADPYQLKNDASTLSTSILLELMSELDTFVSCVGSSCHNITGPRNPPPKRDTTPASFNWRVPLKSFDWFKDTFSWK